MADTPHDGSGTPLSFPNTAASNVYVVTNIVYNLTDPGADDTIDISHLGLTTGAEVLSQSRPLSGSATDTGREISFDFIGKTPLADKRTGTLTITGGLAIAAAGTVRSSTITLATNDVTKGSATIRIARV